MELAGQGLRSERGYAMAVLLVGLGIMAVLMSAAVPVWKQISQREKEEELIFRGNQYARALGLFQRRTPNAAPENLDVLVEQRFLRRKYKDPMLPGADFLPLYQAGQTAAGGRGGRGAAGGPGGRGRGAPPQGPAGGPGPGRGSRVIGVVSGSTDTALRVLNGKTRYNEWEFIYLQQSTQAGPAAGRGAAGVQGGGPVQRPGGRFGQPPPPPNPPR